MNKNKRREIFARFQESNPYPVTELRYNNSFELLVAVILSAQATDISVNKATANLFVIANTPSGILELGEDKLCEQIKSIGLFNTKARNIYRTCQILLQTYCGQVPSKREDLEALPGVGRKTANVLLNTLFGLPTLGVDTHVFRLANRIPLAKGKTVLEVEHNLLKVIPAEFLLNAHHWLVLHGRYICVSRKPKCEQCKIVDLCEYPQKITGCP